VDSGGGMALLTPQLSRPLSSSSRENPAMTIPAVHPYPFDPTYGMTLEQLLAIQPPEAPAGFDAFWQARYRRAMTVEPQVQLRRSASKHADWQVFDVTYTSTGAYRIGGWLLLPKTGTVTRGLVVGHGYGGRDAPDFDLPVTGTAVLFPCFRGLSRSARPPISADSQWHVLHDIDKPDSYVIGGCVEDLWLAVSTLIALYPWIDGKIGYCGISFGGGIGALAIPYDRRIDRGHLNVPTFGNRPLWLALPTIGSAHAVQIYQKKHPNVFETLRWFDSAIAASRIRVPMLMAVALFDPAVAPPCQFSVANALEKTRFNEIFILDAGHFDYVGAAEQNIVLREKLGRFLKAP
jgi:cephalosporin-C deacetylase